MYRKFWTMLPVCLFVLAVAATTAPAQDPFRLTPDSLEGEPTDLEGVLAIIGQDTLEENDLGGTIPTDETEFDSWLQALVNLLVELGLLASGSD